MKKILASMCMFILGLCLIGCSNPDDSKVGYFYVQYDYGRIVENKITILIDGCLPFFDFEEYNIEQVYPGDILRIEYAGQPYASESYPGEMHGIEISSVELCDRDIRKISEEEIVRNEANGINYVYNYNSTTDYVILDEELNYISLSEYTGSTLYASISSTVDKRSGNTETEPKLIPVEAFFAFDPSSTYKLTIQNETDYELKGLKDNYKHNDEVELKLVYAEDVLIYVYLNDEYVGYLDGSNSVKFNMPKEDSTIKISYENFNVTPIKTYKLHIIDDNDYVINKPKEYESYFAPFTELVFYTRPIMDADIAMYVNGKFCSIQKTVIFKEEFLWEFYFRMPFEETVIEFKVLDEKYINLQELLDIPKINSSNVVKVRYEQGHIGVAPGSLTDIMYSTNQEDINMVLSLLEIPVYEDITNNWQITGGGYTIYSIFTNDKRYDIEISNNYVSVNKKHYKFKEELVPFKYPSNTAHSYIAYIDTFVAYTTQHKKLGDFEGLSEFEFYPYNGRVVGEHEYGYLETEIGCIYIFNSRIFYIKSENTYSYYCISGEKDFREIFITPHDHKFVNEICECEKTVYDYIKEVFAYDVSYYKTSDAVEILSYFGEFDGCHVAIIKGDNKPIMGDHVVMEDIVIDLYYENISVYYNNKYYLLEDAIDLNMLSYESVKEIRDLYNDYFDIK